MIPRLSFKTVGNKIFNLPRLFPPKIKISNRIKNKEFPLLGKGDSHRVYDGGEVVYKVPVYGEKTPELAIKAELESLSIPKEFSPKTEIIEVIKDGGLYYAITKLPKYPITDVPKNVIYLKLSEAGYTFENFYGSNVTELTKGNYVTQVMDLRPSNVALDKDGNLRFIDVLSTGGKIINYLDYIK